jgi:alcohol dehydrogenase (cytochrome c)/quinohemoprotein ethanol dehydrogenase
MDSFDFDSVQQITAADLVIDGVKKHVIMQAPKNGVFYVIEAATGQVQSAHLYVPTANWMTGFDKNWRPILNPDADYGKFGDRGFHVVPSAGGAHSWHPMAFSPDTGLMYIPTNYGSFPLVGEAGAKMGNQLLSINVAKQPQMPAPKLEGAGNYLLAWDPVNQKEAWKQPQGSARAGAMATAGNLVFQGSTGPVFAAFRADTGEKVWSADPQANIVGGSATYSLGGEQYVAVVASGQSGRGGGYWAPTYSRLLVYKLGGSAVLPAKVAYTPPSLDPPAEFGDAAQLALGESKYNAHCSTCHGNDGRVTSLFPDLRYATALRSADVFKTIVIDGALQPNGMVSFRKALAPQDAEAIRAYVVKLAHQARNAPPPAFGRGPAPQPAPAPVPAPAGPALHN